MAHKGFPKNQNVFHAISEIINVKGQPTYDNVMSKRMKINNCLKGLRVQMKFNVEKRSKQIVHGLIKENSENYFFEEEVEGEKRKMNVLTYFACIKKYKIKYPNLPLLWIGKKEKNIYVPMEVSAHFNN